MSDPCDGPELIVKLRFVAAVSTSLPVNVIAFDVSSLVVTDWEFATGASLTAVTVMDTVALALLSAGEAPSPVSVTLKVKLSGPL